MKKRSNVLVGLDIGTTKTTAIVGEITETGIDIIGIGTSPAKEIRKGTVVNIDSMLRFYCWAHECAAERRQDAIGVVQWRAGG